jgi:hypothetical protein
MIRLFGGFPNKEEYFQLFLPPLNSRLTRGGGGGRCGKIRTHAISRKALTLCAKSADPPRSTFLRAQARSGYHDPRYIVLYILDEWPKPHG